ncbi:methyl-accepting chemotaxis protein [Rariglobus hedericola]|uniref:Chemotaxis protein n=1 Tax=Rariglobus hedericola TaxID=2597822 RepID=A0A556QPP8_9BACT|nr:methyl-accepting chemotaxis protein [Rariglobus hedericola]TSJ78607.1 chemotaxis protein [Rariglobus hedericola]
MKNWTIGKRIIVGGGTLLALLLIVAAIGFTGLERIHTKSIESLKEDAIPGITNIAEIATNTLRAHVRMLTAGTATTVEAREQNLATMGKLATEIQGFLETYEKYITQDEDRNNFELLKKKREAYVLERARYVELVRAGKRDEAHAFAAEALEKTYGEYRDLTLLMLHFNEDNAAKATDDLVSIARRSVTASLIVAIASLAIALALGWIIIRSINRALREMAQTLDDASSQVGAAAAQVSASSQSLAEGSSEQAASLEETSSSLEEFSSMTKRNADNATSAKSLSGETRASAETGNTDMTEMRQAMDAIKTSSNDIAKIIKTIDEIAFQTNILALNAAVEAARAGEAGAGFAVVADEVRNLAQRSAQSAKETASKIETAIQSGEHGVRISDKVAASLGIIMEKARQVDEIVAEIAVASQEQTQGISQINTAMSQMDKVTQSNAGSAEETAAAAEELNSQAAVLQDNVSQLRHLVGGTQASPVPSTQVRPTTKIGTARGHAMPA